MSIRQLNRSNSAKAALALAAFAALALLTAACPGSGSSGDDNTNMDPDMQEPAAMQPMADPDSNDMDGSSMDDNMQDSMDDGMEMEGDETPAPMDSEPEPVMADPAADQSMRPELPEAVSPPERDYVRNDFFTHDIIFAYEAREIAMRARDGTYPELSGSGCEAESARSMQYLSTAEDRALRRFIEDDLATLRVVNEFEVVEFELQEGDDACGNYRAVVRIIGELPVDATDLTNEWNARIDNRELVPRLTPLYEYPPDQPDAPVLPTREQPPYPPGIIPESLKGNWVVTYFEFQDEDLVELNDIIRDGECVPDNDGSAGTLSNHLILEYDEAPENPAASIVADLRGAGLDFNRIDVYTAQDYNSKYGSETFINFLAPNPLQNFSFEDTLTERYGFEFELEGKRIAGRNVDRFTEGELAAMIIENLNVSFPFLPDDNSVLYHVRIHSDLEWNRQQLNESRLEANLRKFDFDTTCEQAPPFNALFYALSGIHTFFGDDLVWNVLPKNP